MKSIKQRGFTLVEVGLVVAILTLITAAKIRSEITDLRFELGRAQGQQLKVLNDAVYNYGSTNFSAVINNTPVPGVAVTRAPTVAELNALGYLSGGFRATNYYGSNYATSITPAPAGCPAATCNIAGLVYMTAPLTDLSTNTIDGPAIGEAIKAIGADGGASLTTAATINGRLGGWNLPNPLGAVQGILAARSGLGSQLDLTSYLKRDGTSAMSGNLNMGGNTVSNIQAVVSGSACASTGQLATDPTGAVLTCQGGTYKSQGSAYWKDPVANVASLPACNAASLSNTRMVQNTTAGSARAYSCNGAAWQAIAVDDAGNLTVPGNVNAGKVIVPNGNNVQVGSTSYYGDATNSAIRQNGGLFIQHNDGSAADISGVKNITQTGTNSTAVESWALIARNGSSADNAAPQSATGSLYVNDIYVRSVGRWASQIYGQSTGGFYKQGYGGYMQTIGQVSSYNQCNVANLNTGACSCPGGSTPVATAYRDNPGGYGTSTTTYTYTCQ